MRVTVARSLGTCFGVQDAIELAMDASFKGNLTIVGELVHNPQTVEILRQHGVNIVNELSTDIPTPNVMITAHGAPDSLRQRAEGMGFKVYDASCPLVLQVHKAVKKFVQAGYHPVVIGQANHVEVKGIIGDLKEFTIIGDESEIWKLDSRDKIGIVCQTTQQIDKVLALVDKIRKTYPQADVQFKDTVCKPTKDRQVAVHELAAQVDVMIVVGGFNSANTKKLKLVCDEVGVDSYQIEQADELRPEMFEGKEHVGITAGTSTPHHVIAEVYNAIIRMPGVDLAACSGLPPPDPRELILPELPHAEPQSSAGRPGRS
ncbi:MAG: 4-hydroxy-3-methylbut-2-enyl diphosphate reductase [Methanoregulaceae archaeon]|nr:4-hydroxy-3-methylbut-2-enyl diphosphate reductase [Methanoregulaceae archaeon]